MTCYRVRCEIRHINRPSTIGWVKKPGLTGEWLTLDAGEAEIWLSRSEAEAFVKQHAEYLFTVEELGVQ
jgi:hypothetical protein